MFVLYLQGCMSADECYTKQNINAKLTCNEQGSMCTYCCASSDYCNSYNNASIIAPVELTCKIIIILITSICVNL